MPQSFLAIDAVLILLENVTSGMVVYPKVIAKHLNAELPFMATENIMMAAVAAGGDRQELHELIRQHSQDASAEVKAHGRENDLIDRLKADSNFDSVDIDALLDPSSFIGRAPQQVDQFVADHVQPVRESYQDKFPAEESLRV